MNNKDFGVSIENIYFFFVDIWSFFCSNSNIVFFSTSSNSGSSWILELKQCFSLSLVILLMMKKSVQTCHYFWYVTILFDRPVIGCFTIGSKYLDIFNSLFYSIKDICIFIPDIWCESWWKYISTLMQKKNRIIYALIFA